MISCSIIKEIFKEKEYNKPVVHHITNYVTMNDQANAVLAFGGSPIMAEAYEEIEEVISYANALVLNFGTLTNLRFKTIKKAAESADRFNIPIIVDPVGAAASHFRLNLIKEILDNYNVRIIKGNIAEIKALYGLNINKSGIDSMDQNNIDVDIYKELSTRYNSVILKTGYEDIVCYNNRLMNITGGSSLLRMISGSGCILTSIIGVCASFIEDYFCAALAGSKILKTASEKSEKRLVNKRNIGLFKVYLYDELCKITWGDLHFEA